MMKVRLLFLYMCTLLLIGCSGSEKGFVIEGTLPSMAYDGEWMYLVPMENAPGRVDSVKIIHDSFSFSGKGEEMRVLRLRHILRLNIQELLVVTEPGVIFVKADSIGSVKGTPQNDALQGWKENREKKMEEYRLMHKSLRTAVGEDSLHLVQSLETLANQERKSNVRFLQKQGNNTLGKFMQKMIRNSLTVEQQKKLDGSLQ